MALIHKISGGNFNWASEGHIIKNTAYTHTNIKTEDIEKYIKGGKNLHIAHECSLMLCSQKTEIRNRLDVRQCMSG